MSEIEIRKAIIELQERIDLYEENYRGTVPEYYGALKTAVKVLEKQIPVTAIKEWCALIGFEKYYTHICPKCEKVLRQSVRGEYCPHCGQRIDWEEND